MSQTRRHARDVIADLLLGMDARAPGEPSADTVPSGYPSLDRMLGGGFRRRDLVVLGGDVGSGKSAFALGTALRSAAAGFPVALFSGEMEQSRVLERALAIEGRVSIDEMRIANLSESKRAALGAAALRIRDLPLTIHPLVGGTFDETFAQAWPPRPAMVVVDYLQTVAPRTARPTHDEEAAAAIGALKALALERDVVCFVVSQLPHHRAERPDPRPTFDDFGALGAITQHADVILGLYREGMYKPDGGVEGATELVLVKNRNGPTGFVDLYFYESWMRFEDMLDPGT